MRVEVPVPVRICLLVAKRERGSCVVSTGPRGRRGPTEGGGRRASRRTRSRSPWPPTWSAYRRRSSQRLPLSLTPRPARRDGPTRTAYDRTRGAHGTTPPHARGAGGWSPPAPLSRYRSALVRGRLALGGLGLRALGVGLGADPGPLRSALFDGAAPGLAAVRGGRGAALDRRAADRVGLPLGEHDGGHHDADGQHGDADAQPRVARVRHDRGRDQQRGQGPPLDQRVDRGAGGVLERVADRVADDGGLVRLAALAAE